MIRPLRIVKIVCDTAEDGPVGEERKKAPLLPGVPKGTSPFIVSVARRYQGQGLSMAELVAAGEDGWQRAQRHFGTATDQFERWGSRWVQESILLALCKGEEEAGPLA